MTVRLLRWGNGTGLMIPAFAARTVGFKPYIFVQVVIDGDELRVKHIPRQMNNDDLPNYKDYCEEQIKKAQRTKW